MSKIFLNDCVFYKSVFELEHLPTNNMPEIALIGRSNVGKSSLLNFITDTKNLAKASKTPGRTRCLNFFHLADKGYVVDMPGYGFASAPKKIVENWQNLIILYLKGRVQLKRAFLLIDSRHGLKQNDLEIMKLLNDCAISFQIILTKIDKISHIEYEKRQVHFANLGVKNPALYPDILSSSVLKEIGLSQIVRAINTAIF